MQPKQATASSARKNTTDYNGGQNAPIYTQNHKKSRFSSDSKDFTKRNYSICKKKNEKKLRTLKSIQQKEEENNE